MSLKCKKCDSELPELSLSLEQLKEIKEISRSVSKMHSVKKLMNEFNFDHKKAKIVIAHLNTEFGKCINCSFDTLKGKNIICPKCQTFNYNS